MKIIKGPDFPTGGVIHGRKGITEAYKTGRGIVTVRGRAEIEEAANGRSQILITEIPYQVNKTTMIEKIAELVKTDWGTKMARDIYKRARPTYHSVSSGAIDQIVK